MFNILHIFHAWRLARIFAVLFGFFFGAAAVASDKVTLAWDANPEPDLVGYRLHYGTTSGTYTTTVDVGNVTKATVNNLSSSSSYFFVVTAYNEFGESPPSNEASFTPTASAFQKSTYVGLIDPLAESVPPGYFSMTVTATGVATGRLVIAGISYSWRAAFDSTGRFVVTVNAAALGNVVLTVQLDQQSGQLSGTIESALFSAVITADLVSPNTALQGRYTAALFPNSSNPEEPQGYGYATFKVSPNGKIRIVGRTGDGTPLAAGLALTSEGRIPLHVPLYGSGCLAGEILFRDIPGVSDADGTLLWCRPARESAARFATALNTTIPVRAARFESVKGAPVMSGLAATNTLAMLTFSEGDLPSPGNVSFPLTMWGATQVMVFPPNTARVALQINRVRGLMTGSFTPDGNTTRRFRGVILQKGNGYGYGLFIGDTHSGRVDLEPGR